MRAIRTLYCFAACLSVTCLPMSAQEVVHAVEGTVSAINQKGGTITLTNNVGTGGLFKDMPAKDVSQAVEKDLRSEVVPVAEFTAKGDQVVMLFEGYGDTRTAVAVHDLGTGAVTVSVGTVVRYDKHGHMLTLKTDDGKQKTMQLDGKTIVDTPSGAAAGMHFEASKGDRLKVAVSANPQNGTMVAVFVAPVAD